MFWYNKIVEQDNFKRHVWIGVGIIAGSMVVFGVAFYILAGNIQKQADAITVGRNTIANQSALINSYSNLKENAAAAAAYQAAMDKLLATQDNLIAFPSQIDGIARNDGVDMTFSFQGDPVPASLNTAGYVGFKLDVTGPLSGIIVFLKNIESSAPILLLKIDTFDLAQSGSGYALAATGRVFFK
jgi:hypothetical protein